VYNCCLYSFCYNLLVVCIWLVPLFVTIAISSCVFLVTQWFCPVCIKYYSCTWHGISLFDSKQLYNYIILHNVLLLTCSVSYLLFLLWVYGRLSKISISSTELREATAWCCIVDTSSLLWRRVSLWQDTTVHFKLIPCTFVLFTWVKYHNRNEEFVQNDTHCTQ